MHKLEVFFDYICPFCLKGHEYLKELYQNYPTIEIFWCPCESHPRPESHGRHSDLCMQAMFFAKDQGVDLWAFHDRMYKVAIKDRIDIENIDVLAEAFSDMLDKDALKRSLQSGEYQTVQQSENDYAYDQNGVWAVPSYRMDTRKLDSIEGVGITKEQLKEFMDTAK